MILQTSLSFSCRWEVVIVARKVAMCCLSVFFSFDFHSQGFLSHIHLSQEEWNEMIPKMIRIVSYIQLPVYRDEQSVFWLFTFCRGDICAMMRNYVCYWELQRWMMLFLCVSLIGLFALVVMFLALLVHVHFCPFSHASMNMYETCSLVNTAATFFCGMFLFVLFCFVLFLSWRDGNTF